MSMSKRNIVQEYNISVQERVVTGVNGRPNVKTNIRVTKPDCVFECTLVGEVSKEQLKYNLYNVADVLVDSWSGLNE